MNSVHDVAACILQRRSPVSAMKLQTLVYYAQAWSRVWDDWRLFAEVGETGPWSATLYDWHCGYFDLRDWRWGNPARLDAGAPATAASVLDYRVRVARSGSPTSPTPSCPGRKRGWIPTATAAREIGWPR